MPDRPPALGRLECKDGYVVALLIEDWHWRAFVELMGNPEWASGPEWGALFYRAGHLMEIAGRIGEWAIQQSKEDVHHRGAAKGFAIGSVYSAEEVMNYRQYLARDFFAEVNHPQTGPLRCAGLALQDAGITACGATPRAVARSAQSGCAGGRARLFGRRNSGLCRSGAVWKGAEE